MSWTNERIIALKNLWALGETASAISRFLGAVSRNAAIGKAQRLNLPPKPRRAAPPRRIKTTQAPTLPRPRASMQPRARDAKRPRLPTARPLRSPEPPPLTQAPEVPVTTLSLTTTHCRWPMGDPHSGQFFYCGRTAAPGKPYCPHHNSLAHNNRTRPTLNISGI